MTGSPHALPDPMVPQRTLDRRAFLRATALGLAAIPLSRLDPLAAWAEPRTLSRVALVRTADRRQGVHHALALLDPREVAGRRVVLKPNFNSADPTPASTHDDTLVQLVRELQERGARSITLGESSGPGNTRRIMERKGVFDLAREHGFDVVDYDEIPDSDWVRFGPRGTHWPDGFYLPRLITASEYTVTTCCLKTHGYGGVYTLSLKLSVGLTPKRIRSTMHRSPDMRRMIAELNTGYRPDLVVLDGVDAFTDGGPAHGRLKKGDVILAGRDRVAIDAVGLAVLKELGANDAIMGRGIFEQEQMARAVELGLGARRPADIQIVTGDAESRRYADRLRTILDRG